MDFLRLLCRSQHTKPRFAPRNEVLFVKIKAVIETALEIL